MKQYRNEIFSFLMLMAGVLLEYAQTSWFALPYVSLVWFLCLHSCTDVIPLAVCDDE